MYLFILIYFIGKSYSRYARTAAVCMHTEASSVVFIIVFFFKYTYCIEEQVGTPLTLLG